LDDTKRKDHCPVCDSEQWFIVFRSTAFVSKAAGDGDSAELIEGVWQRCVGCDRIIPFKEK